MKLVSFHLMPYRPLDLEEAAKHRSPWVVLPNHLYDPVKGAEEYERHIDALVYAEELGFDAIGVNEHHQTAYGLMPAPNLIASALIQRTKRVQDRDPRARAAPGEQSRLHRRRIRDARQSVEGPHHRRLCARHRLGIPFVGRQPVFLARALPRGARSDHPGVDRAGPFAFDGEHFNVRYVNLWPRPYQTPHPPVWIPSQGSSETVAWAADPKRKYPFLVTFSSADLVARYHTAYREEARRYGYEAAPDQLGWACPIYVAETDERARAEAGRAVETLFNDFLRQTFEMLMPPGYTSMRSMKNFVQMRKGLGGGKATAEGLIESGTASSAAPKRCWRGSSGCASAPASAFSPRSSSSASSRTT